MQNKRENISDLWSNLRRSFSLCYLILLLVKPCIVTEQPVYTFLNTENRIHDQILFFILKGLKTQKNISKAYHGSFFIHFLQFNSPEKRATHPSKMLDTLIMNLLIIYQKSNYIYFHHRAKKIFKTLFGTSIDCPFLF